MITPSPPSPNSPPSPLGCLLTRHCALVLCCLPTLFVREDDMRKFVTMMVSAGLVLGAAVPALAPRALPRAAEPAPHRAVERPHRPPPALHVDSALRRAFQRREGRARGAIGGSGTALRRHRRAVLLSRRPGGHARRHSAGPSLFRKGARRGHQPFRP